jgi:hypothetical protein
MCKCKICKRFFLINFVDSYSVNKVKRCLNNSKAADRTSFRANTTEFTIYGLIFKVLSMLAEVYIMSFHTPQNFEIFLTTFFIFFIGFSRAEYSVRYPWLTFLSDWAWYWNLRYRTEDGRVRYYVGYRVELFQYLNPASKSLKCSCPCLCPYQFPYPCSSYSMKNENEHEHGQGDKPHTNTDMSSRKSFDFDYRIDPMSAKETFSPSKFHLI